MATQPSRVATWLLKHFGCSPNNDSVLGDLAEQYLRKNSSAWYWQQVIKAIAVSLFTEIRAHPWIAARAILTGWGTWILGGMLMFPLAFVGTNIGYDFEPQHPIATAWSFMWMPVLGQAGLGRPFYISVLAVALPFMVGMMCGWLVARLHRDQQTGAVLLFACSILLVDLLLFVPFILALSSVGYLFVELVAADIAVSILGILYGGGLIRDRSTVVVN
jgi:hypothetical protein